MTNPQNEDRMLGSPLSNDEKYSIVDVFDSLKQAWDDMKNSENGYLNTLEHWDWVNLCNDTELYEDVVRDLQELVRKYPEIDLTQFNYSGMDVDIEEIMDYNFIS